MNSTAVEVSSFDPSGWAQVNPVWAELAIESPYTTFFISPEWVESWLEVFGPILPVEILVFRAAGRAVGACLLVRRSISRGPFPVRCVFLNTAGENEGDSPYIEFNNLLCLAGWEQAVAAALMKQISKQSWDEIWLNGFCQGPGLDALVEACAGMQMEREVRANFYVDLKRLRETGTAYEAALGAKDRARLRQNLRFYGETQVGVPSDRESAMKVFDELAQMHTKSWEDRNQTGAFASALFRSFHLALMRRALRSIQLVRVSSTEGLIGLLYNMIYRGKVYFYQSGLVYSSNKRVRPGFVTLARTIHYCLEHPELEEFHFMPGSDHYKEPMSTNRQELEWVVFQKRNLKNAVIRHLRHWKRKLKPGTPQETPSSESE